MYLYMFLVLFLILKYVSFSYGPTRSNPWLPQQQQIMRSIIIQQQFPPPNIPNPPSPGSSPWFPQQQQRMRIINIQQQLSPPKPKPPKPISLPPSTFSLYNIKRQLFLLTENQFILKNFNALREISFKKRDAFQHLKDGVTKLFVITFYKIFYIIPHTSIIVNIYYYL